MTSLQEAQAELNSQEAALAQAQSQAQQQQQQAEAARNKLPNINSQQALRGQQFSSGIMGQVQRQNIQNVSNQLSQRINDIQGYEGQLNDYETNTLQPYSKQIQDYQNQLNSYNSAMQNYQDNVNAYNVAERAYLSGNNTSILGILSTGGQAATYLKQMLQNQGLVQGSNGTLVPAPTFTQPTAPTVPNPPSITIPAPPNQNPITVNAANQPRTVQQVLSSIINSGIGFVSAALIPKSPTGTISPSTVFSTGTLTNAGYNVQSTPQGNTVSSNPAYTPTYSITGTLGALNPNPAPSLLMPSGFYQPSLQGFAQPQNLGSLPVYSLTPSVNPATQEQINAINSAQQAGSFANFPPVKFLSGGYGWQQQTLHGTPLNQNYNFTNPETNQTATLNSQEAYNAYVYGTPFKELISQGNYPAAVTKAFYSGAQQYLTGATNLLGGNATQAEVQPFATTLGQIGLFSAFSPAISSGISAQLEPYEKYEYDYTTGKWMIRNQITGQLKPVEISPQEAVSNIKQDLVERTAGEQQIKYLNDLYNKFFKDAPNGKQNFQKLVQDLYASGEFKGIPLDLYNSQAAKPLIDIQSQIPLKNLPVTQASLAEQLNNQLNPFNLVSGNQNNKFQSLSNLPSSIGFNDIKQNAYSDIGKVWTLENPFTTQQPQQNNKELSKINNSLLGTSAFGLANQNIQQQNQPQKTNQAQRENQLSNQSQPQPSLFNQANAQVSKSAQRTGQSQTTETKLKPKSPFSLLWSNGKKDEEKERKVLRSVYKEFIKKKGKYYEIGQAATLEKASLGLKRALKSGLQASGYVKSPSGRVVPAYMLGTNKEFKPSKRNPLVLVEQRGYRLSTYPERSEIQSERRAAGRSMFKSPVKHSKNKSKFFYL